MEHADKNQNGSEKTLEEILNTLNEEQRQAVYAMLGMALEDAGAIEDIDEEEEDDDEAEHSDSDGSDFSSIFDTMNDEQLSAVKAIIGLALEEGSMQHSDVSDDELDLDLDLESELDPDLIEDLDDEDEYEHSDEEGDFNMNLFENTVTGPEVLQHSDMEAILKDAPQIGSLRKSVIEHGIDGIEVMFPDAKTVGNVPEVIARDQGWVSKVLNGAKKSPFSRIKSIVVNLTMEEARAKGYIKGKKKIDEQFTAMKRVTTPQTVYKKQALDRDDIIDITDFDVVAYMRSEMRMMLNEELARAAMVGDGRAVSAEDKINPQNIRPIYTDDEVYAIHYDVEVPAGGDITETSNAIVDAANMARIEYKGSGSPTFYADPKTISTLLLARDKIGNRMYRNMADLAAALRVTEVVEVPVMENQSRTTDDGATKNLIGIIVNMVDYTFGADKGGQVSMFDDFDIDYNKEKYLIETRCSGALTRPKSAIVLEANA